MFLKMLFEISETGTSFLTATNFTYYQYSAKHVVNKDVLDRVCMCKGLGSQGAQQRHYFSLQLEVE